MSEKKIFDYVIGNPPYQKEFSSDGNKTYAAPVYNDFMDAANEVAEHVELIHPARFLFNAGSTPKAWNKKMLKDPHFKVLKYEEDATKVFPNTDIKGGVAITYHDIKKEYGAIQVFAKYKELNDILNKILQSPGFQGMDKIVLTRTAYHFTEKMHVEHPNARYKENMRGENIGLLSKGHDYDMATNIFERIPEIFSDKKPDDEKQYIRILGRINNERVKKWVRKDYVNCPATLYKYTIDIPKANGKGDFGEVITAPIIDEPGVGSTETFISVGAFDTKDECENCLKYVKTKFARALLNVLKTTQDITPDKWKYVPLQDFTSSSDINWKDTIYGIDRQLFKKYHLNKEEIIFLQTKVKDMK